MSRTIRWYLAKHPQGQKRMHREGCRFAAQEYIAMRDLSVQDIVTHLGSVSGGAPLGWHDGCMYCALDLHRAINDALGITPEGVAT